MYVFPAMTKYKTPITMNGAASGTELGGQAVKHSFCAGPLLNQQDRKVVRRATGHDPERNRLSGFIKAESVLRRLYSRCYITDCQATFIHTSIMAKDRPFTTGVFSAQQVDVILL